VVKEYVGENGVHGPAAFPTTIEIHYSEPAVSQPGTSDERSTSMNIIIGVLITFLVVILVLYLVNMLPIDGRAKQIVRVIVIVIGIISLLKYLAVF